ncbi:MAG TPA: DUF1320 family protein [Spirochaetia bacterium]|nr:DUF1320 family protein [Spirochaetia bacterium]
MPNLYAAAADVLATLSAAILDDLAKDTDGGTDHTLTLIESMSRRADGLIRQHKPSGYIVPLTDTQAIETVRPWIVDVTRFMLLERALAGKYDTEGAKFLYEKALAYFESVAKGEMDIPGAVDYGASASTAAGTTSWTSNTVMYPVGTARGF